MPWPALLDCLPATEGAVQRGAFAFIAENAFASGVQEAAGRTSTPGAIDGPGGLLRLGLGLEYGGNINRGRFHPLVPVIDAFGREGRIWSA